MVEIVRELQLEVKSGNMTELLLSNEKNFGRYRVASGIEQRNWLGLSIEKLLLVKLYEDF